MHFDILVEDQAGKKALDTLVPKIVGSEHTFKIHSYKGIGRVPKNMRDTDDPAKRILLENLPKLLKGYGKTHAGYRDYPAAVVVVCDLDDRCLKTFRDELLAILGQCHPRPNARFCFAVEEGEAWLLGDLAAVTAAYPNARKDVLHSYLNDTICGTWEKLVDAVHPGGSLALSAGGWQVVGGEKSKWAQAISQLIDVETNNSPSFRYFRDALRALATQC